MKIPKYFIRHEQPRAINPDGTYSIYCQTCGREIMRAVHPQIRSIKKCAICVLKAQGVENPEDVVLAQYALPDPTKPPIPLDYDVAAQSGVLLLYPDAVLEEQGLVTAQSGGVVGTVKSIFKALSLFGSKPPQEIKEEEEEPLRSTELAREKRGTGLYGPRSAK
jgi:hypothetical protein